MRSLRSQKQTGRLGTASATLAVAAILSATAFAVPAAAETADSLAGAVTSATEGAASAEKAPAVSAEEVGAAPGEAVETPSPVPDPVEVQEAPGGADSTSTAPAEGKALAPSSSTSSTPSVSLPDKPASTTPAGVRAPAAIEPDTVAQVTERRSELVEAVRQAPAAAAGALVEHVAQTATGHALLETADRTIRTASSVGPLSQAAKPVHAALDLLTAPILGGLSPSAPAIGDLLPPASAPVGFGPPDSPSNAGSLIGPEPASPLAAGPPTATLEGSSLARSLGAFGGIEALRAEVPGGAASSVGSSLQAMSAADVYLGSVTGARPNNPLPARPAPPFRSPGATPGSGGSLFVPVVALLALLALAAPATFRRRMEVPDFLAPTPFVCALERPG